MSRKSYSVSEFKAKSLGLLERVSRNNESITVTKRGKPIAKVIPIRSQSLKPEPGRLEGTIVDDGDIISPLGSKMWKATK